jgi:transmembrane sensor
MNNEYINWDALVNYVTGHSSRDEEEMIREWISMDPRHEDFIEFLENIWQSSAEEKHEWDVDAAWSRFNKDFDLPFEDEKVQRPKQKPIQSNPLRRKRNWNSWVAVAASVLIIFSAFVVWNELYLAEKVVAEEPSERIIETQYGQRTYLNLSDGSSVILNAGSTIRLPEYFNQNSPREVHLSGEAFFEVEHDPNRPFIVYTDDSATEVLGTTFQVSSYPEYTEVEVVVSGGKVALQNRKPGETGTPITKNQLGVLAQDGSVTVSAITDLSPYLGWTEGNLVFFQTPLRETLLKLERWYNIETDIDTTLALTGELELTASFSENQTMDEVLEAISLALNLKYIKTDGNGRVFFTNNQSQR